MSHEDQLTNRKSISMGLSDDPPRRHCQSCQKWHSPYETCNGCPKIPSLGEITNAPPATLIEATTPIDPSIDPYEVVVGGVKLDPYRLADLFGIHDPAISQALKKLVRCGRKHKTLVEDLEETITTLQRKLEMIGEDSHDKQTT